MAGVGCETYVHIWQKIRWSILVRTLQAARTYTSRDVPVMGYSDVHARFVPALPFALAQTLGPRRRHRHPCSARNHQDGNTRTISYIFVCIYLRVMMYIDISIYLSICLSSHHQWQPHGLWHHGCVSVTLRGTAGRARVAVHCHSIDGWIGLTVCLSSISFTSCAGPSQRQIINISCIAGGVSRTMATVTFTLFPLTYPHDSIYALLASVPICMHS